MTSRVDNRNVHLSKKAQFQFSPRWCFCCVLSFVLFSFFGLFSDGGKLRGCEQIHSVFYCSDFAIPSSSLSDLLFSLI